MKRVLNISFLFLSFFSFHFANAQLQVLCPDNLVFTLPDTICEIDFEIPEPEVLDNCGLGVDFTLSGDFSDFVNENINAGSYLVKIKVEDGCGESIDCFLDVIVQDTTSPELICEPWLVIEIPNSGIAAIYASDFDDNSYDNCNQIDFFFTEDQTEDVKFYDCCGVGVYSFTIWAFDESGNSSTCTVNLLVEDNFLLCSCDGPIISGIVQDCKGNPLEAIPFDINNGSIIFETYSNGEYQVEVWEGDDIQLTPSKDNDFLSHVTTFDLVLIRKHILNVQKLNSPYKLIAADVNNDSKVTTQDLIALRKLILHIDTSFANNTSWRFIKEDYEFPNSENPWEEIFPESCLFENIIEDKTQNFIGIKIGNVN